MIINATVGLTTCSCGHCDMQFAVPETFWNRGKREGGDIFCPVGHKMRFGESENDRLRRELAAAEGLAASRAADLASAQRREAAAKGQVTKLRKRAEAGACPCCNRTFVQLARHIKTKHPGFDPAA